MMVSVVRIVMPGAGTFAEVSIVEGDTVSRLTERACVKFSHWGANAAQIDLYLAAAGGDDMPTPSAVDSARHLDETGWPLERAGIFSGAWLVARKVANGAPARASGNLTVRQAHGGTVGGHLPRRMLTIGVGSAESGRGALKEE